MILSNGNFISPQIKSPINISNLDTIPKSISTQSSALNTSIISRIHNVRSGCGSCGRK